MMTKSYRGCIVLAAPLSCGAAVAYTAALERDVARLLQTVASQTVGNYRPD